MQTLTKALLALGIVTVLPLASQAQGFIVTTNPTKVEAPEDGAKYYVKNSNTFVNVAGISSHKYKITGAVNATGICTTDSKLTIGNSSAGVKTTNTAFTLDSEGKWTQDDGVTLTVSVNVGNYTPTASSELKLYGSNVTYTGTGTSGFSVIIGTPPPPPGT